MRVVLQRVFKASVKVDNQTIGQVGQGLLLFLGVGRGDSESVIRELANKALNLRIFSDENDKMNLSILDVKGEILVISQFTLHADTSRGRRPSFVKAAEPKIAEKLIEKFIYELKKSNLKVEKGQFGAKMEIEAINDGPVTIILNSDG